MKRAGFRPLFSTRRQEEITRIAWDDFQKEHKRVMVRDMKHPGEKIGNDAWVDLTKGEFPRRYYLTPRCVVWDLGEVEAWLRQRRKDAAPQG